jgi:hypothetical protein
MSLLTQASICITPNGYKEGKLYSVIPSDGSGDMSVVRATTATRVNSAGLVELVPYNLLGYSQDFTNAYWNKNNGNGGTLPIVTANYATNPFGASNASRIQLQRTSTSGSYSQVFTAVTLQNATQYTWSVWLKSLSGTPTITIAYNGASYSTITLTNEWVRYELPLTTNGSYFEANFGTYQSEASTSLTADFLAWGFQLVEGSTAKDYQKTETRLNIPRLDYSNGTCPSLLVEPQRTNLALQSSSFDNAVYTKSNATITANVTTSPDGYINADKVVEDTANALHRVGQGAIAVTSGVPITFSFFAKAGERTKLEVQRINTSGTVFNLLTNNIIDLTTGVVPAITGATSYGSDSLGNGWFRYYITLTPIASGSGGLNLGLVDGSGNLFYTGDGTSGAFVYGFQAELGSYATSYIPTTSASVTRNADVISKTGISSLIGQTEGTLFLDFQYTNADISAAQLFSISDGTGNNRVAVGTILSTSLVATISVGGSLQFFSNTSFALVLGQRYKAAISYKSNNFAFYVNGVQIGVDASGSVPATSAIGNNSGAGGSLLFYNINAAALWKTRLTNDELATLTTI